MYIINTLLGLSAVSSVASASFFSFLSPRQVADKCYSGVYIIAARGSGEPVGFGLLQPVAQGAADKIPDSLAVPLQYPAASIAHYFTSEPQGTAAMTKAVESYVDMCPDNNIVLMGYSQGAAVVGDTLCGTNDTTNTLPDTPPLPSKYGKNIIAIITFGDPDFIPGEPFDVGTAKMHGYFPRTDLSQCSQYFPVWQSYCTANDTYCASGTAPNSHAIHGSYADSYGTQAVQYVVDKANNASGATPTGTASSSMASQTGSAAVKTVSSAASIAVFGFWGFYVLHL